MSSVPSTSFALVSAAERLCAARKPQTKKVKSKMSKMIIEATARTKPFFFELRIGGHHIVSEITYN